MKTWKLVSGILSTIFFVVVMFQSCAVGVADALTDNEMTGGSIGVIMSIMLLTGGIVSMATRNSNENGGDIAIIILYGIGACLGLSFSGDFSDLNVWGGWCLICVLAAGISLIRKRPDRTNSKDNNTTPLDAPSKNNEEQTIVMHSEESPRKTPVSNTNINICPKCGSPLANTSTRCVNCSYEVMRVNDSISIHKFSRFGTIALVLSLIGLLSSCLVIGAVFCIIAMVFALLDITKPNTTHRYAIIALICGFIGILISIFVIIYSIFGNDNENIDLQSSSESETNQSKSSEIETESGLSDLTEEINGTYYFIGDITFNDVEWGTSYKDTCTKLETGGIELGELISGVGYFGYTVDQLFIFSTDETDFDNIGVNAIAYPEDNGVSLYGIDFPSAAFYFAYTPVNGQLTETEFGTAFYGVQCTMYPSDYEETLNNLLDQLYNSYGNYNIVSGYDPDGNECNYAYWIAQNGCGITLNIEESKLDDTTCIYLTCGYLYADEWLEEAYTIISEKDESNTDVTANESNTKSTDIIGINGTLSNVGLSVKSPPPRHACMSEEERLWTRSGNEEVVGQGPHGFRIFRRIVGAQSAEQSVNHF